MYKSIFEKLRTANSAAIIISAITIVVLLVNNEIIKVIDVLISVYLYSSGDIGVVEGTGLV